MEHDSDNTSSDDETNHSINIRPKHDVRYVFVLIGCVAVLFIVLIFYQIKEMDIQLHDDVHHITTDLTHIQNITNDEMNSNTQSKCPLFLNKTILTFGDSLTSGFPSGHPYSLMLSTLLPMSHVISSGIPGEMTSEMLSRLTKELPIHKPNVIIILGGTNDILRDTAANITLANIINLHELAKQWIKSRNYTIAHTIAVTIPEIENGRNDKTRYEINNGLREYARSTNGFTVIMELEGMYKQSLPQNSIYWNDDCLHFSPLGYDKVGEVAYEVLCSLRKNS